MTANRFWLLWRFENRDGDDYNNARESADGEEEEGEERRRGARSNATSGGIGKTTASTEAPHP